MRQAGSQEAPQLSLVQVQLDRWLGSAVVHRLLSMRFVSPCASVASPAMQPGHVVHESAWAESRLVRVLYVQDMTYSKQLEQYEDAVMQKRLEEMPETERARLYEEVEAERKRRGK